MTGKEFEQHCLLRMEYEERQGRATMRRYGVQGSFVDGKWNPIQSLPDFEGVLPPLGRQFIFDAKVCSQASFDLAKFRPGSKETKARQLEHLLTRAEYGAVCFFLIHWPEREMVRRTDPAMTCAFPVSRSGTFWLRFADGETTSLTRMDCAEYGVRIPWNTPGSCRTPRPDVMAAIEELVRRSE